jgi:hypothetical protein
MVSCDAAAKTLLLLVSGWETQTVHVLMLGVIGPPPYLGLAIVLLPYWSLVKAHDGQHSEPAS